MLLIYEQLLTCVGRLLPQNGNNGVQAGFLWS